MPIFKGLYKNLWCLNLNKIKIDSDKKLFLRQRLEAVEVKV